MTRPSSITELISAALLRTRLSRGAEGLLLGSAAGILTACGVALSSAPTTSTGALIASAVSASACAATWWLEHRRGLLDVARVADRRLEQNGALVTSFERERQGGLAALLAAQTFERLPQAAVARAAPGPALAFIAAPLIAAALFASLAQRSPKLPAEVAEFAQRSAAQLAQSSSAGTDARAAELAHAAAAAASAAADGSITPAQAGEALRRAEARLSELVSEREQRKEFDPALWSARDLARAALRELSTGSVADSSGATAVSPGAAEVTAPLKNSGARSTMAGSSTESQPVQRSSPDPAGPAPLAAEVGTVAGRWWPTQYDDVVARWLAVRDTQ